MLFTEAIDNIGKLRYISEEVYNRPEYKNNFKFNYQIFRN